MKINFEFDQFEEFKSDILSAGLAEIGFESFVIENDKLEAYIDAQKFEVNKLDETIATLPIELDLRYTYEEIKSINWNEEWEKNFFEPIIISNQCVIHSTFHKDYPSLAYEIVIDPKMAFGTGHHETTSLMIAEILEMDIANKSVLDMGCGTAVLAILAKMRGAGPVVAVDIDDWCTENSEENIQKNNVSGIEVLLGGAEVIENKEFDIVIANINRNILLQDMNRYYATLNAGGVIYMSGFYEEDIPVLEKKAQEFNLKLEYYKTKNKWAVIKLNKV